MASEGQEATIKQKPLELLGGGLRAQLARAGEEGRQVNLQANPNINNSVEACNETQSIP